MFTLAKRRRLGLFGLVWLAVAALVAIAARATRVVAQEQVTSQLFQEQLAAGEFSAALEAARRSDPGAKRDERLVQLAVAQASAGTRSSALATLAYVSDDRARHSALQSIPRSAENATARGGAQADFDTLIDLLTNTVRPPSWDEVGGPGTISEFQNGVYVDVQGVLRRALSPPQATGLGVARLAALAAADNADPRRFSPLRKVSLVQLEKYIQLSLAAGRPLDDEMLNLAGLERIRYVFVYPESRDLVLAGPAGAWRVDHEGRHVSQRSGRSVLQLDDLVVMLRYLSARPRGTFGCSIDPTREGLARTRAFAERSSAAPLKPGKRPGWLKDLREQMGRQAISVQGIDARTRAARVLVEADYRMKLVGMGLEEGTLDVPSYLDLVTKSGEKPQPLDVLRWWFTLKYDAVQTTVSRDAFEIRGQGVQVLSENELLTQLGQRVHTGASQPHNREFAARFTRHFSALAEKYPVYSDLENIFDLALVAALIGSEQLAQRMSWHLTCFGDGDQYQVALGFAPRSVETVINHRLVGNRQMIVGVSGGVRVEPWTRVRDEAIAVDHDGKLESDRQRSATDELPLGVWWWD